MEIKMMTETEHLRFEWSGGAYIAVFSKKHDIETNVINVWNYELDKPVIERRVPRALGNHRLGKKRNFGCSWFRWLRNST
jgi:hypothetical protein